LELINNGRITVPRLLAQCCRDSIVKRVIRKLSMLAGIGFWVSAKQHANRVGKFLEAPPAAGLSKNQASYSPSCHQ
jgi:hypothetical protein